MPSENSTCVPRVLTLRPPSRPRDASSAPQTCPRPLTNPPRDVRPLPPVPPLLQSGLPLPLAGVRRRHVPQGRPAQRGRGGEYAAEPAHGPCGHGRDDGGHEDADGDDGPTDGHHGVDQFLLPGLCVE